MEANFFTEVTDLHCHLRSSQIRVGEHNERLKISHFLMHATRRGPNTSVGEKLNMSP